MEKTASALAVGFAALLASILRPAPASAKFEQFTRWTNGSSFETDGGRRLRFKRPDGSVSRLLTLPGELASMAGDSRYVWVGYRNHAALRMFLFRSDGSTVLDASAVQLTNYLLNSSPTRVALHAPHDTYVFDAGGALLCHENDPKAKGIQCRSDPFIAVLSPAPSLRRRALRWLWRHPGITFSVFQRLVTADVERHEAFVTAQARALVGASCDSLRTRTARDTNGPTVDLAMQDGSQTVIFYPDGLASIPEDGPIPTVTVVCEKGRVTLARHDGE